MKINLDFVEKIGRQCGQKPCNPGIYWFIGNFPDGAEHEAVFKKSIDGGRFDYSAWGLAFSMSKTQAVRWAIHCARSVLHIYEAAYPDDMRPRRAIEAAEAYLANPCAETRKAARAAWAAARAAAEAARHTLAALAALAVVRAAEDVAWVAARAAEAAYSAAGHAAKADPSIALNLLRDGYRIWKEEEMEVGNEQI